MPGGPSPECAPQGLRRKGRNSQKPNRPETVNDPGGERDTQNSSLVTSAHQDNFRDFCPLMGICE